MAAPSLADLTAMAAATTEPFLVAPSKISPGGVDPLGLRQINFDLMDQVLPGLNNVARHIRPFVVTTWAWRRARQLAQADKLDRVVVDLLRDFVDRIEVIYAWSQFLRDSNADLPGRQVLAKLVESDSWEFGGEAWVKRCKERQYSTAFSAPITYGPGLKTLGWVATHKEFSDVLIPLPDSTPALDAFEQRITPYLEHPVFSKLGTISVKAVDVREWADKWALEKPTQAEKRVLAEMLLGTKAPIERRRGCQLMLATATQVGVSNLKDIRLAMAGRPSTFVPEEDLLQASDAWRRVQVRQLFRLSLEALFFWLVNRLVDGPRSSDELVEVFLSQSDSQKKESAKNWLNRPGAMPKSPATLLDDIQRVLESGQIAHLPAVISDGIAFSIAEAPAQAEAFERHDRLPLTRARRESLAWGDAPLSEFLKHVMETWVLAQHLYWAVGRGLADARSQGKKILRLRVVLDELGWTLAPGATARGQPAPSEDRLRTAMTLAEESGCL